MNISLWVLRHTTVRNMENAYDVYAETLQVDGLGFKYKNQIKDHFWYFKEKLEGQRFDAVAYGIQKNHPKYYLLNGYQTVSKRQA